MTVFGENRRRGATGWASADDDAIPVCLSVSVHDQYQIAAPEAESRQSPTAAVFAHP